MVPEVHVVLMLVVVAGAMVSSRTVMYVAHYVLTVLYSLVGVVVHPVQACSCLVWSLVSLYKLR